MAPHIIENGDVSQRVDDVSIWRNPSREIGNPAKGVRESDIALSSFSSPWTEKSLPDIPLIAHSFRNSLDSLFVFNSVSCVLHHCN